MSLGTEQTAVLNHDELLERCGGNAALADRLLDRFLALSAEENVALSTAVAERDLEKLRSVAHKMKGSAYTVSANRAGKIAAEIEQRAMDKEWVVLSQLVQELEITGRELREAIEGKGQSLAE